MQILKNIIDEYKKIEWTPLKNVFSLSVLVVLISLSLGIYVGVFELGFTSLLDKLNIL